ncbi:Uncharacterised protein [Mycobacteroides abscessus subsp. abscessus]|nr:Uncharacterised protein [Mycobacteroides abscessus subsp. abscessus]
MSCWVALSRNSLRPRSTRWIIASPSPLRRTAMGTRTGSAYFAFHHTTTWRMTARAASHAMYW